MFFPGVFAAVFLSKVSCPSELILDSFAVISHITQFEIAVLCMYAYQRGSLHVGKQSSTMRHPPPTLAWFLSKLRQQIENAMNFFLCSIT